MHQLRASHLRATFKEFHALPSSENFACIWEVRVLRNISTQWFCMKSSVKFIINLSVFSFRSTHTHFPLAGEDWRRYASSYHTYQTEVLSSVQDWAKSHDCNLLAVIGLEFWAFWGTCLALIEGTPLCSKRLGQAIVLKICAFHARMRSSEHLHCILFHSYIFLSQGFRQGGYIPLCHLVVHHSCPWILWPLWVMKSRGWSLRKLRQLLPSLRLNQKPHQNEKEDNISGIKRSTGPSPNDT